MGWKGKASSPHVHTHLEVCSNNGARNKRYKSGTEHVRTHLVFFKMGKVEYGVPSVVERKAGDTGDGLR